MSKASSLTYTVSDGQYPATATITITVQAINDAPVAIADAATIDEDSILTDLNVLANDLDVDEDLLTVIAVDSTNTVGVVIYQDNGLFSYDTNSQFDWLSPGESASDSFTYTLADTQGITATTVVTLTITGVNDVPVAVDDAAATEATSPVTITVLLNDSDADGDTLTLTSVTAPAQGTTTIVGDEIVYTADSNFTGEVRFTYTVSDGHGGSDTATVTVQVTAHTYQLFMPLMFSSPATTPPAPEQGKDVGQSVRGRLTQHKSTTTDGKPSIMPTQAIFFVPTCDPLGERSVKEQEQLGTARNGER